MPIYQKVFGVLFIVFCIFLAVAILYSGSIYMFYASHLTSKERVMNYKNLGITLYDDNDEEFFTFYDANVHGFVPIEEISENAINALIAAEDKEFYSHNGYSIIGITRAMTLNFQNGTFTNGGSTVTQQLVKNTLLSSDRSIARKLNELVLSIAIENHFEKDEILEMYFNSTYFGEGAFGIEKAANYYFGNSAKDLTIAESSFIIGILPAPSYYSPFSGNRQAALARQRYVIVQMLQEGYITEEEYEYSLGGELVFDRQFDDQNSFAPHFALAVRDELIEMYGEDELRRSGFRIKTTLNRKMQDKAQEVLYSHSSRLLVGGGSNAAAVVVEPATGDVKAMVGSVNWNNMEFGRFNMALAPRQPGSSFKPIVYALALSNGTITPASILTDKPITYEIEQCNTDCIYKPQNYDRRFRGNVTVRQALSNSLNVPAVEVMNKVGVAKVLNKLPDIGIENLGKETSNYGISLVLGAGNISLLEMTNAYATFANRGEFVKAHMITEIRDKYGKSVKVIKPEKNRAWSEEIAYQISNILSDQNARASTFGNMLNISRPAAVKTGTTENYRDAWTIGYTPDFVVGVWAGNNDNRPMGQVPGSQGAAPIWRELMETYHEGLAVKEFEPPKNLVYVENCYVSVPGSTRSAVLRDEYFRSSEVPTRCNSEVPRDRLADAPRISPIDEVKTISEIEEEMENIGVGGAPPTIPPSPQIEPAENGE